MLVAGTAIGLFFLNNILLGAIVPRLPGGSATGITTMFVITWLSLKLKQFGVIPIVFFIYGLIGLPSHLAVGDNAYFLAILFLVVSTLVFDLLLKLNKYKISSYFWAFPVLAILVKLSTLYFLFLNSGKWELPDLKDFGIDLLPGYAGIAIGCLTSKIGLKES